MGERLVETLIGAVVLIVAGVFFFYAYTRSNVQAVSGYELQARFGSVGSLAVGSDVRISGIKVGTVTHESLDPQTYMATVRMSVEPDIKVPDDSAVRIAQDGLLGDHYLVIEPGGSEDYLRPGGRIMHTQGAVDLLSLVGQAIFSAGGSKGPGDTGAGAGAAAPMEPLAAPDFGFGAEPGQSPAPADGAPRNSSPAVLPDDEPGNIDSGLSEPDEGPASGTQALPPQPAAPSSLAP